MFRIFFNQHAWIRAVVAYGKGTPKSTVLSNYYPKYGYDVNRHLLFKTNKACSPTAATSYCYDRVCRLIEENNPNWKRTLYSYDASYNRSKMMVEGKSKDELVSVTSYEYDRNNRVGKETRKQAKITETYRYRYDDNVNETFRIWERTAPTPEYPGTVRLSNSWKMETPTVYERRHYDGFNQLIRIYQDEREITYQYRRDSLRHRSEVRNLTERKSKTNALAWDCRDIVGELTEGKMVCHRSKSFCNVCSMCNSLLFIEESGTISDRQFHIVEKDT